MKSWRDLCRWPRLIVVMTTVIACVWYHGIVFTVWLSYESRWSSVSIRSGAGEVRLSAFRRSNPAHDYDLGVRLSQGMNDAANKFLWRSLQPFYLSAHWRPSLEVRTRHSTLLVAILGIHLYRRVRKARRTPVPTEAPDSA